MNKEQASFLIKQKALQLGFVACGIAKAEPVEEPYIMEYEEWLSKGYAAGMDYLHNNKVLRYDPRELLPGVKSLVVVAMNYYPSQMKNTDITFSYYSYGMDYHFVVKKYLSYLYKYIEDEIFPNLGQETPLEGRAFTDSAPIMERYWARKAGVGFQGRNQLIIVPGEGSYCFLGILGLNVDLVPDKPIKICCGKCHKCEDACPTGALCDGTIDSNKCISYQTIENRTMEIPKSVSDVIGTRVYGCDACQQACPWNKFAKPTKISEFSPSETFLNLDSDMLENMGSGEFKRVFRSSAVVRAGLKGLKRNLSSVKNTIR